MTVLIVSAPAGPTSFTATWARATAEAARAEGQDVLISDLTAMRFDPAERGQHYDRTGAFDPLKAQSGDLPPDVAGELAKVRAADWIVFHFPIWWFAPPAAIKGWCDRVLAHGHLHDVDNRFDRGLCRGKTAVFCVTTGAEAPEVGPRGKEGRLDLLLWPLAYTLRYCGMDVAMPAAEHGVHGYHHGAAQEDLQTRLAQRLASWPTEFAQRAARPRWDFHADTDFDETGRLRDGIDPLWPFHAA